MRRFGWLILALGSLGSFACTSTLNEQIRTGRNAKLTVDTSIDSLSDSSKRADAAVASIEHHPNFLLGVIEFSDEGLAWSEEQRTKVLEEVKAAANGVDDKGQHLQGAEHQDGAILVTFVHGWQHNASLCDDNVACFRRVLDYLGREEVRYSEAVHREPRKVIGLYLGWRGLLYCGSPATFTSIWNRKSIDEHLGNFQARTVINQVLRIYTDLRQHHPKSRLIMAGHSLGAGVLYSAVAPLIRQRLHDAIDVATEGVKPKAHDATRITLPIIRDLGDDSDGLRLAIPDLVVLANPAFEAELYKATPRDLSYMAKYNLHFDPKQQPILVTVSSPRDWVTGVIFPVGQFIYVAFHPTLWLHGPFYLARTMITSAKYPTFITDEAITSPTASAPPHKSKPGSSCFDKDAVILATDFGGDCGCGEILPGSVTTLRAAAAIQPPPGPPPGPGRKIPVVSLKHLRADVDASNPFLVVRADGKMINSHDDIYNATFLSFLEDLLISVEIHEPMPLTNASNAGKGLPSVVGTTAIGMRR